MTPMQGAQERRSTERVPLGERITLHFTQGSERWTETDATLVDVSAHGMFIRCDRIPRHGQHVLVGLLHYEHGLCAAWGQTVRRDGLGGFGVQFKRANDPLSIFVEELSELSSQERACVMAESLDAQVWIDADDPF